ncbi:MAG: type II secretion system protein E [Phycisphaerae bacterium]|nr:MAG: type II secretion system protein E [Phycisphaerae bacterium]
MIDSRHFVIRTLLADGVLKDADVRRATEHAVATGADLLDSLAALGIVTSRKLAIAKAKICEYPFVDLSHYEIDYRNSRYIPRAVAERLCVFPLFFQRGTTAVAMLDPLNLQAVDQVRQLVRRDVDPVVADAEQLRALISRAYSMVRTDEPAADAGADQTLTTGDEPIVAAVNQILAGAAEAGASDIHINPDENDLFLRYRVDGVLAPQQGPPRASHAGIVQRLKVLAKLDLAQTRKPQDGKFRFVHKGEPVDIRLSLLPTIHGENVVMRLLRAAAKIGPIASLGMPPDIEAWYEEAIAKPHGMILVTGPTGSGKTTTLYTALHRLNSPDVNIITIEDPVEIRLSMVRQVQAAPEIGLTFAAALRSVLRQDPDVVLVGEIRDDETAKIAVQAALTGHLVFSTLHTNDAVGALARLTDFGVPGFAINNALLGVLAQRLVRRLCGACAAVDLECPARATLPPAYRQASFHKAVGCGECGNAGYKGRMGVYELFRVTPAVQGLIERTAPRDEIEAAARANGMRLMWEDAVEKASRGLTSLDEALTMRVFHDRQSSARIAA